MQEDGKARPKYIIDPTRPAILAWNLFVGILVLAMAFIVPFNLAFGFWSYNAAYWLATLALCADVLLGFATAVRRRNVLISDPAGIAASYLRGTLVPDLLAALPLAPLVLLLFGPAAAVAANILLLARLLYLSRFSRLLHTVEKSLKLNPSIMRLIGMIFWFTLVAHLLALGWIAIGAAARVELDFGIIKNLDETVPQLERYVRALYFMTTTMATIGYGDISPHKDRIIELVYTIFVQFVGVGMYGYIIGNVSSMLANLDVAKAAFRRRMEEVNAYMRSHRLPHEMRTRIRDYYDYMWEVHQSTGEEPLLDKLPRSLSLEVRLFLNREILSKVPFFKDADEVFVREIVTELRALIFVPGDYIVRKGEFGDCMYFISSGRVEVMISEPTVIATLRSGSHFGEMSLVEGGARNASVVARDYCDVYELSKESFELLRSRHPEFDRRVQEVVAEREKANRKG
ncbi:MAG: hypothetical protein A2Z99_02415 [Treponema sp. GWB1_62_6]|nr:MAG: hypothetical protein A2Z99_02415 [Treponema sp. GWB1_62_6]OHE69490.1 MAG: hypothetical protein A2001_19955 [Treponema sp. GWC1_61_84]OHE72481.1 MAG: hypothetical protein A2413_14065 [Treponema sp. RIFOXYC1_FULL_61_9]HCM24971.1 hypothetical protein [Treponema sp.]